MENLLLAGYFDLLKAELGPYFKTHSGKFFDGIDFAKLDFAQVWNYFGVCESLNLIQVIVIFQYLERKISQSMFLCKAFKHESVEVIIDAILIDA